MSTRKRLKSAGGAALIGAALLTGTACQDLLVENLLDPDRERATSNASDVETLIGAAYYPNFFRPVHGTDGGLSGLTVSLWTNAASDLTATLAGGLSVVWYLDLVEPRREHPNHPTICSTICEWGPRDYWARIGSAASILHDGLQLIDGGMRFIEDEVDVTARAQAFAKFMQGWTWGYTALVFDQVNVVPETIDIPADPTALQELTLSSLVSSREAMEAAVGAIEAAIAIAQANPDVVHFPSSEQSSLWFSSPEPISNQQFIQIANTLAARLLVLGAASPEDRANGVDWQRVLNFTANGIQAGNDLQFQLTSSRNSQLIQRIQNNTAGGTANARLDYRTIGMADQSGAYQAWINAPVEARNRFDIVTPDRRITGPTPTSNGSYARYRADNNGFLAERGFYFFSAYQWGRHGIRNNNAVTAFNSGAIDKISADENNLLRAEALIRTGNPAAAAELINVTRTRPQQIGNETFPGLPPVTAAGVPEVDGQCVPRTDSGACGTLMTALRYERMLELIAYDALRGYADSRGFGMLPDGSLAFFPVPGNVLNLYGLPVYTFGGVGGEGSLMYAPVN